MHWSGILCLGADLTILSTLRIISAASAADIRTCLLTWNDSVIPNSTISAISPWFISVIVSTITWLCWIIYILIRTYTWVTTNSQSLNQLIRFNRSLAKNDKVFFSALKTNSCIPLDDTTPTCSQPHGAGLTKTLLTVLYKCFLKGAQPKIQI